MTKAIIFLVADEESLIPMSETAYENEDILNFFKIYTQVFPPTINTRFQIQLVTRVLWFRKSSRT